MSDPTEVFTDCEYPLHCKFVGGTITRRDYFAAMAMQALASRGSDELEVDNVVVEAVILADSLIAELEATDGK